MGQFGRNLKKLREQRKISKVKLSKKIGTSDAYLRQIENQDYKPPTFNVCEKISNELSLTELEKKQLFESAFLERISSEKEFYNFLKEDIYSINHDINSVTIFFQPLIENAVSINQNQIKDYLIALATQHNIQTESINISPQKFTFTTHEFINKEFKLKIEKYMNDSSSQIKNEIKGFSNVIKIWKPEFETQSNKTSKEDALINTTLEHVAKV